VDEVVGLTALWFEGRMLSEGSEGTAGGGMSFDDWRREARSRGEAGTELRSGIVAVEGVYRMYRVGELVCR
jgi:hypothetical protein